MTPGAITVPEAGILDGRAVSNPTKTDAAAEASLEDAIARFTARNKRSLELHAQALESMPGGNTRAQMYTYPFLVCMKSGQGYQVTSEDGHTYAYIQSIHHVSPPVPQKHTHSLDETRGGVGGTGS